MRSKSNQYRIKKITYKDGTVKYFAQCKNKLKNVPGFIWLFLFTIIATLPALYYIIDTGFGWEDIENHSTQEKACAAIKHFIHIDNIHYEEERTEKLSVTKLKSEIIKSCA